MATRNVETFRAAHQEFNKRDFDAVAGRLSEDFTYEDRARNITFRGPDGFKDFLQGWVDAFSDGEVSRPVYTGAGDTVIAEFVGRGVNDGPMGEMPATGKEMKVPMCEVMRFDDEGRIVSGAIYYDQLSIMTQLGHLQPAEKAPAG